MKKQLLFAFGAAALLASCSSEIDSPVANVNDGYLQVNGTIDEIKTRVSGITWETGDQIGVSGGISSNILFSYNDGFTSSTPIKVTGTTTFTAYYPYSDNTGEVSFKVVDAQNAPVADQSTIDFMFAEGVSVTQDNPTANFTFKHKMSQLKLTVEDADNQFTDATVSLSIMGVTVDGKFNTSNGTVTTGSTKATVKVGNINFDQASIIIIPSFASTNTDDLTAVVEVTKDNNTDTYTGTLTPALAAGNQYGYTLSIKKNNPDLGVGGTITDWEQNEMGEVEMGKQEPPYQLAVGDYLLKDGTTIAPSKYEENKNDVIAVVFYVGNPCPQTVSDYSEDNDILFQDFYKGKLEYDVVTEIDATAHGLAVAINNANSGQSYGGYASAKIDITTVVGSEKFLKGAGCGTATATTQFLGYNYTNIIKNVDTSSTGLENIKNIITSYETGVSSDKLSGWFLPTVAEFNEILGVYSEVNGSITTANGTLDQYDDFTTDDPNEKFYWTSEQRNGSNQWISPLSTSYSGNSWLDKSQTKKGYVRLCIAF